MLYNVTVIFREPQYSVLQEKIVKRERFLITSKFSDLRIELGGSQSFLVFLDNDNNILSFNKSNVTSVYIMRIE